MYIKKTPLFSPRLIQVVREEEKMRHIVILVREVKAHPTYPHGVIWFDEIKANRLVYSVLLVRTKNGEAIDRILEKIDPTLSFSPERIQHYGDIEVNCFTLEIEITPIYLYSDSRVHPTRARQKIVRMLEEALGHFRDYYGGLLQKNEESLCKLKSCFSSINEEFIEDFFYSIHPQKMQATLPVETLRDFLSYSLFCFNEKRKNISQNRHGFFACCSSDRSDLLSSLKSELYRMGIDLHSIISASFERAEMTHFCLFIPLYTSLKSEIPS